MKLDLLKVGGQHTQGTVSYPDGVTEVYTFKNASGQTLLTVTLVYVDSTKAQLSSWSKTPAS